MSKSRPTANLKLVIDNSLAHGLAKKAHRESKEKLQASSKKSLKTNPTKRWKEQVRHITRAMGDSYFLHQADHNGKHSMAMWFHLTPGIVPPASSTWGFLISFMDTSCHLESYLLAEVKNHTVARLFQKNLTTRELGEGFANAVRVIIQQDWPVPETIYKNAKKGVDILTPNGRARLVLVDNEPTIVTWIADSWVSSSDLRDKLDRLRKDGRVAISCHKEN